MIPHHFCWECLNLSLRGRSTDEPDEAILKKGTDYNLSPFSAATFGTLPRNDVRESGGG